MVDELPAPVVAQHQKRIEQFVVTARRISGHSLLTDLEQFRQWASGSLQLHQVGEERRMTVNVPPEESFESLAARCRPVILDGESCHYAKVLGSVRAFLNGHPTFDGQVRQLSRIWKSAVSPADDSGFAVLVDGAIDNPKRYADLANSWLYGDLVHADEHDAADGVSINIRFMAAVVLYGQVAMSAVATLNVIKDARSQGAIAVANEAFDTPVSVDVPLSFPVSAAVIVAPGDSVQDLRNAVDNAAK